MKRKCDGSQYGRLSLIQYGIATLTTLQHSIRDITYLYVSRHSACMYTRNSGSFWRYSIKSVFPVSVNGIGMAYQRIGESSKISGIIIVCGGSVMVSIIMAVYVAS